MTSPLVLQDRHAERRLKVLNSTSASQIDRWEQCERQWFGGYVEGVWVESTEPQKRGTAVDLEVQHYYRGEPVAAGWEGAVRGIVAKLPPNPRIQHKILVPTYDGGPLLVGYPDFLYEVEPRSVLVLDLKSLSDYRYAKTKEQLAVNTQMVTYSAWGWSLPAVERVRAGHLAARFRKDERLPVGYRFMDARLSELAEMERGRTLDLWGSKLGEVVRMVEAARSAVRFEDLAPTGAADVDEFGKSGCERFGGCHFRGRCGFAVSMQVSKTFNLGGPEMGNGPSLMEQLEAMKNGSSLQPAAQVLAVPGIGGQVVGGGGGGGPPGSFPPPQAAHLQHPGLVLPASAGYAPGQPCNGGGYYASANGQGFIPVEAGHMCPSCVGPQVIDPRQVLPPDAPARTSTPAEIEAVVEGKKRGRKPKAAAAGQDDVIAVYARLGGAGYTVDQIGKLLKSGEAATIIARLDAPPAPAAAQKEEPEVASAPAPRPASAAPGSRGTAYGHPIANSDANGQAYARLEEIGFTLAEANYLNGEGQMDDALAGKVTPGMLRQPPNRESSGHLVEHPAHTMVRAQLAVEGRQPLPTSSPPTAAAPTPPAAPAPAPVADRPPAGLVLLVDCAPVKGAPAVLLADWLAPVLERACRSVLDDAGRPAPVVDLRLVPFARGKGYLGAAVRAALGTVPASLAVDTSQYGADVVLESLTPWAATIIKGGAR